MCRFVAYRGGALKLEDLLYAPSNGLIHQAVDAMESTTKINADGFGLGWYNPDLHPEPAVFKDTSPAWNNRNLRSLAGKVASECIFAHVRAARRYDPISDSNCHPFQYRRLLWMHNGDVPGRGRLHRRVLARIGDDLAARITGNTDTELAFSLFLSLLGDERDRAPTVGALAHALAATIEKIAGWWREDGDDRFLGLNFCVSDGRVLVASRFARGGEPLSLHHCTGGRFVCEGGVCRIEAEDGAHRCVMVCSEVLSEDRHWNTVEPDTLLLVDEKLAIEHKALAIP